MKNVIKEPVAYFMIGLLVVTIVKPLDNLFVNIIIVPICFLIQIISLIFMLKGALKEKAGEKNISNIFNIKWDRGVMMSLLAAFSSLFAAVVLFVLLLLLNNGDLDAVRSFITITGCVHMVIVLVSFITFFKILAKKK